MTVVLNRAHTHGCELSGEVLAQLQAARLALGITQRHVAMRIGVTEIHFGRMERGTASPRHEQVRNWARVVGFEAEYKLRKI